ncbi:uncharacterized protein LOC127797790 [Diospyros lotus]|uniref:uncharacterized protein LOC127797790 n=1 Tax=Diospyros lotus TaxID=55363 RepID=UPI002253D212|nr:uncharacterized protein LOC127797790 [Diospyros lotus]XP_052186893.1 uncharacterized protein LOC127797790 [Diospyros lotus]
MLLEAIGAAFVGFVVIMAYYGAVRPPPPKPCRSDSPTIRLRDGRRLAYKDRGVPRETANYKVIIVHGFDSSKDIYIPVSQEQIEELGISIVTFDRAGYGESDPNPNRSRKSEAFDVQELADQLNLGPKFYVLGISIGAYITWACLKYIPHRLAGAALIVPVINYWWPSFPPELCSEEFKKQPKKDQWKLRIAHYAPGFLYWWMSQKWFSSCSIMARDPVIFSRRDFEILKKMLQVPNPNENKIRQQGEYESLYRDLMVGFGKWEFNPMELKNPWPQDEGGAQIWQGYEDKLVPSQLQRFVAKKLPWIKYYEVPDGGHLIIHDPTLCNAIFRALLLKQEPTIV